MFLAQEIVSIVSIVFKPFRLKPFRLKAFCLKAFRL